MNTRITLWVGLGSGLGGLARVSVASIVIAVAGEGFPFGVLVANILGSFLIGLIAAWIAPGGLWKLGPAGQQFLLAGFCGGFTTFSFFSFQTMHLLEAGQWALAMLYSASTVIVSLAAVWAGYGLGRRLTRARFCRAKNPGPRRTT